MKTCPTCQRQFPEEYDFCLKDGTRLVIGIAHTPFSNVTQSLNFCGQCATPMSGEYAFCKKCGTPRSQFQNVKIVSTASTDETVAPFVSSRGQWFEENKLLVIIASVIAAPLLIGFLYYALSGNEKIESDRASNFASNVVNRAVNSANRISGATNNSYTPPATTNSHIQSERLQTGRLTTDSNIRSDPNKDAVSLGIHFKGARVRIIEETSYMRDDALSSWYKVKVYEYGCSVNTSLGCGKNTSSDADEGWINAKNILLD